jgi:hypothetical protein
MEGELRKVWEAVRQDLQLKTHLNRWLVGCAIGSSLAGVGCCPAPLSMEGYSEYVKKVANGAYFSAVMGMGMGTLGLCWDTCRIGSTRWCCLSPQMFVLSVRGLVVVLCRER